MEPITLPSGKTAVLRDPQQVSERARRPVTRLQARIAAGPVGELLRRKDTLTDAEFEAEAMSLMGSEDFALLDEVNDLLIVALVASWSYDAPVTLDSVLDLPQQDYEALKRAVAPHVTALMPDFSTSPDPDSPTVPSDV